MYNPSLDRIDLADTLMDAQTDLSGLLYLIESTDTIRCRLIG